MANPRSTENNGFGPIFEPRGTRATKVAIAVVIILVILVYVCDEPSSWTKYESAICFFLLSGFVGEMLRRLCLFTEEYRHLYTRYNGNIRKALRATFELTTLPNKKAQFAVLIVVVIASTHILYQQGWEQLTVHNFRLFVVNAVFIPIIFHLAGLREASKVEYSLVSEREGGNMADSMAWNYYFGYLKLVLPNLKRQINLTEEFRYKIQVPKLFIIIPKNCQVLDKISESDSHKLVMDVGNLEPIKINRGGIRQREYKHTVHRIVDEKTGDQHFCVAEYAVCLMTFYEMTNDPNGGFSREERDRQVVLFIRKVKEILDGDPQCKDQYTLVTVFGNEQNIGQVLIGAMKDCALEIEQ